MKLMKLMMCAAMLSMAVVACDKDDEEQQEQPTPPPSQSTYLGVLTVDQNDGETYKRQNVEVKYVIDADADGSKLDIYMYKVKFAEAMPMELDMTIPAVDFSVTGDRIELSGEGIIPLAMGGQFPAYTITDLSGKIENDIMTLSMMCGEYPLSYTGVSAYPNH